MKLNSKEKGDIAELKVMLYYQKNGYTILTPFGDKDRYDLVVEKNNIFQRIQVKYVKNKNGVINVPFYSQNKFKGKYIKHKYSKTEIDILICYCPTTDKLYKFKIDDEVPLTISLRINKPKMISKTMNFAIEYEIQ